MNAKLYARSGEYIETVGLPEGKHQPDVIVWRDKTFRWSNVIHRYVECSVAIAHDPPKDVPIQLIKDLVDIISHITYVEPNGTVCNLYVNGNDLRRHVDFEPYERAKKLLTDDQTG